jgi:hypothetical protein
VSGPCLSPSVTGRPLRPATRHRLGEPLPHQQADRPRAPQEAPGCPGFDFGKMSPLITCGINSPFGELSPTSRQIAHVLRTRSPLDFLGIATKENPVRLACLIHAASVRSEPESNSPLKLGGRGDQHPTRPKFEADAAKAPADLTFIYLIFASVAAVYDRRTSTSLRVRPIFNLLPIVRPINY